jgi:hypothetical protein
MIAGPARSTRSKSHDESRVTERTRGRSAGPFTKATAGEQSRVSSSHGKRDSESHRNRPVSIAELPINAPEGLVDANRNIHAGSTGHSPMPSIPRITSTAVRPPRQGGRRPPLSLRGFNRVRELEEQNGMRSAAPRSSYASSSRYSTADLSYASSARSESTIPQPIFRQPDNIADTHTRGRRDNEIFTPVSESQDRGRARSFISRFTGRVRFRTPSQDNRTLESSRRSSYDYGSSVGSVAFEAPCPLDPREDMRTTVGPSAEPYDRNPRPRRSSSNRMNGLYDKFRK